MGKKDQPASEPLGGASGKNDRTQPDGWTYTRGSHKTEPIDMRDVGRYSVGDQNRGHKA